MLAIGEPLKCAVALAVGGMPCRCSFAVLLLSALDPAFSHSVILSQNIGIIHC